MFEGQYVSVKPNHVRLQKCEWPALFLSSPWFSAVFRLVPIRGILCVSCSRHLSFYIVYGILVLNFMSRDISSEISSSPRPCGPFLKVSGPAGTDPGHPRVHSCSPLLWHDHNFENYPEDTKKLVHQVQEQLWVSRLTAWLMESMLWVYWRNK